MRHIVALLALMLVASPASAGPGIGIAKDSTLHGTGASTDPLGVNGTTVQLRVSGSCTAGSSIRAIAADGTVTCETDDDTLYIAGVGITLTGTTFAADTTYVQRRVSATCAVGSSIRVIAADGTVTCQTDTNSGGTVTSVSGGTGVTITNPSSTPNVALDNTVWQSRVTGTCTGPNAITSINAAGTVVCSSGVLNTSNVSGTTGQVAKFTGTNTVGDGWASDNGTTWGVASKFTITEATGSATAAHLGFFGSSTTSTPYILVGGTDRGVADDGAANGQLVAGGASILSWGTGGVSVANGLTVASGNFIVNASGSSQLGGNVRFSTRITPTALGAGPTADYNPTGMSATSRILQDCSAATCTISGLGSTNLDGRLITICNISTTNTIALTNEDAASSAVNRFILPTGATFNIGNRSCKTFEYDSSAASGVGRWRPFND